MTMKRSGSVSVWIGSFANEKDLLDYVEQTYAPNGEVESAFLTEHPLGWYDHDFSEANFFGTQDIRTALLGHSYGESFADLVAADVSSTEKFNSFYLIYDIDASGVSVLTGRMRFLGVYPYSK